VVPNYGKGVSGEKDKEEGGKRKWQPEGGEVSRAASRERGWLEAAATLTAPTIYLNILDINLMTSELRLK
jgi:hypothetical protein